MGFGRYSYRSHGGDYQRGTARLARLSDRSARSPGADAVYRPPLQESFQRFYGFSEEQARKAVAAYREYFADTGLYENEVYPGIPELLADLKDAGKTLALATSKPAVFAERILEHFQLRKYFSLAAGSELDGTRVHKADVIAYALEQTGFSAADALMIGDRCYDIDGARAVGTQALGVAYGYGSREELEKAGASMIAENVEELRQLLQ